MNKRPKILYLQQRVPDSGILLEMLEELASAYQYVVIHSLEEFVNRIQDFRPDIILADLDLEDINSKEALGILQLQETDIPFILICNAANEDAALDLLKAGAADYVLREKLQRLFFVLYNQSERLRAIHNMRQAIREKERLYKRNLADTTALKMGEKQILKSKANLRTLFNHTETAYLLVGDDLRVISYNLPAERLMTYFGSNELAEGADVMGYFPPQRHSEISAIIRRVLGGEDVHYHATFPDPRGDHHWFSIKWNRVANEQDQNWGFILSIRDITSSKVTAMALAQANGELSRRNKSLEQFTYIISHNLLAPVANIMGITQLLKDPDEDQHAELVEGLHTSIKTMDTIIKDLSEALQVKDEVNKKKEDVDLLQLVEEIKFSINNLITQEEVTVTCEFEALSSMFTVRGYLYSVFYNLMLNSIKYRRPGIPPFINISTAQKDGQALISFSDNGKGIDMNKHGGQLFALYKRFDTSTDGKGMGMFMVKTQIEELSGNIWVESELDKGTTILISLPLQADPAIPD